MHVNNFHFRLLLFYCCRWATKRMLHQMVQPKKSPLTVGILYIYWCCFWFYKWWRQPNDQPCDQLTDWLIVIPWLNDLFAEYCCYYYSIINFIVIQIRLPSFIYIREYICIVVNCWLTLCTLLSPHVWR